MAWINVYFSLGTNLSDRRKNLDTALSKLDKALGYRRAAISSIIETEAWGFEGENFLNAAAMYRIPRKKDTESQALEILDICKRIEKEMGRDEVLEFDKNGRRVYHSRIIDIDILFFGAERISNERLTVPHPLIAERGFVLIPLREIAGRPLRAAFPEFFKTN